MKTYQAKHWLLAAALVGLLGATSCDPALCPPSKAADTGAQPGDSRAPDKKIGTEARAPTEAGAAARYGIELTGAHSHIYKTVVLQWAVRDLSSCTDPKDTKTCKGVAGLPIVAVSRSPGGKTLIEQPLDKGKLEDSGNGTYAQTRTFTLFGSYAVGLKFEKDGQTQWTFYPYETARAGGEKYFCDTDKDGKNDVAFQLRWNTSAEAIVADDSEVTFSLELMRSFNTPIDTTTPWTNLFDHLSPKQIGGGPTVRLMADKGTAALPVATLTPLYKGKGIYEVKRKFSAADLGGQAERTFWLELTFTDDAGCTVKGSADPEEYYFPVAAKK